MAADRQAGGLGDATTVAARLDRIHSCIAAAAARCGRPPEEVRLIGASKLQPVERLEAAYAAGLRIFGENRVQEGEAKRPRLPGDTVWHLLGPLQSNKVKRSLDTFSVFHAVDRDKIARRLEREAAAREITVNGFLEVNLGDEETKHGYRPGALIERAERLTGLRHLRLVGLMAIPPFEDDPERMRPWFRRLRELRDRLAELPGWEGFPGYLSMGMSFDFEVAIEEGATHVRIGTLLFGERPDDAVG